jgi:tripartite-type tricarboxylate transporter receptor subunit TctC
MHPSRRDVVSALAGLFALGRRAAAADLPPRIIIVVPFGAGSGIDFAGRLVAEQLGLRLGVPVVVENRTGAGGVVGAESVAKAQPDGGTLLLMDSMTVQQNWLHKNLPFDAIADFAPIAKMTNSTLLLCARSSFAGNGIRDVVAMAKAEPGKLSAGTSGIGSPHYLDLLLFNTLARIDIVNVSYRSTGEAVNDLIAGQIPLVWSGLTAVRGQLQAGSVKVLGSASAHRVPLLPDVPTFAEEGVPGVVVNNWFGLAAPAKTPSDIVARLSSELAPIAADPDFQKHVQSVGLEAAYVDAAQFGKEIREEHERFGTLIRGAGIVPE